LKQKFILCTYFAILFPIFWLKYILKFTTSTPDRRTVGDSVDVEAEQAVGGGV
jgi:uncharacterized membrane protein